MDDLPTDYDVIVIGTGMTGAIVAAAVSRIGKTVLHIDENEFYGEDWASFNLETISSWIDSLDSNLNTSKGSENVSIGSTEVLIPVERTKRIHNVHQTWRCPESIELLTSDTRTKGADDDEQENSSTLSPLGEPTKDSSDDQVQDENLVKSATRLQWSKEKLQKEHRKFNLDLSPRMLYSRGSLVELLISSNIARYAEFKTVSRVLTWRDNRLEVVPCSRADVFATKHVSIVQKRMLVKMLTSFADYSPGNQEFESLEHLTFTEYLKSKKVDEQLIHYIVYAIAMGSTSTPCLQGVESCQKFLQSLGRYGNTPFIFPLYGSGEIPQCFCRLCAVFGGIYHLKRAVTSFVTNSENSVVGVVSTGKRLNAKTAIVAPASICPSHFSSTKSKSSIFRAIFITNKSIADSEKEAVTLLQFPPKNPGDSTVTVMELGPSCQVCPPGLFLVHMTTTELTDGKISERSSTSAQVFEHVVNGLFRSQDDSNDQRPEVIWSLTWDMPFADIIPTTSCPANLKIFPGPDASIDYEHTLKKAQEIFQEIFPEEEFLPRAPDSDEIVLDYPDQPENGPEVHNHNDVVTGSDSEDKNRDPIENTQTTDQGGTKDGEEVIGQAVEPAQSD